MANTELLMKEYFVLKDQMKRLNFARSEYMETYECKDVKQDDYKEPPKNCHQRRTSYHRGVVAADDMCEPCQKRHWFYLERKKNSQRRSSIMRQVRHLVKD